MAAGDVQVQSAVHSLDQGRFAFLIRAGMFSVLIIGLSLLYLLIQFKGLGTPTAMDQAQIARNLAEGKGFTTRYIRPIALGMMQERQGENTQVDLKAFPDFYHAPLNPWINSFVVGFVKSDKRMAATDLVYSGDRIIAGLGIVFFILSVAVWYFVLSRLFDTKLALFACAAVLLTDLLWDFSLSGLPQMLVLLLFSLTMLATLLAMEAHQKEQLGMMIGWLIASGIGMGLMTLAHGLAVWIFIGWLIFAGIYFRPRGLAALASLAAFLLVIAPWMVRNYQVCGNPLGLAVYDAFFPGTAEDTYARNLQVNIGGSGTSLQGKVRSGVILQAEKIAAFLGMNVVAGAFFVALFHPFRSRKAFMFKWCILLMWVCAVVGMALYHPAAPVSANQLHILFIPLFIGFGMAFLFVLWNRLELGSPLLRIVFICVMLFVCAIPLALRLTSGRPQPSVQWPPYVPPFIAVLGEWFTEDETICSDMPWAVAWYAQRYSLLMPASMKIFNNIHDYGITKQPLRGLYLTPVSGNERFMSDIVKGRYREWAPVYLSWAGIFRGQKPQLAGFPLTSFYPLPVEGECIIFADRERWLQPRSTSP
jgi:4-amino-4-deoxy-L-arabinose transferase-like glycosyltransferase